MRWSFLTFTRTKDKIQSPETATATWSRKKKNSCKTRTQAGYRGFWPGRATFFWATKTQKQHALLGLPKINTRKNNQIRGWHSANIGSRSAQRGESNSPKKLKGVGTVKALGELREEHWRRRKNTENARYGELSDDRYRESSEMKHSFYVRITTYLKIIKRG